MAGRWSSCVFVLTAVCVHHAFTLYTARGGQRSEPDLKEKFFTQILDHFNYNSLGNGTYPERYLITDQYWRKGQGPVFFYTGNEGDVWDFALNSGFIIELAAQQDALVIFAEHRYYGKSLPFGQESFNIENVGLLTVEQALADYAVMITALKEELGAQNCPVIVFGGSYGGMLSVYMRIRYPNVVAGALAASAPILSTAGMGDSGQFFRDVTADFENYKPACKDAVKEAFKELQTLAQQQAYAHIQSAFSLCKTPSSDKDIHQLNGFLRNAFTLLAMMDYPYATSFMSKMPPYPVKVACEVMLNGTDVLSALRDAVGIVYNSTGTQTCFDVYSLYVECADPTGCGLGFNSYAWDYQACTEIEMYFESNNVTDMFPPMPFTQSMRQEYCAKRWAVLPRPGWLKTQYWGDALSTASNIIFSNGDLDPWANGGIRKSLSESLIAVNIADGAHHLDLRASNDQDPASVIKARQQEATIIAQWVKAAREKM
ncbi:dipeptidyl peptidase 2 isoform 1-T2 [Clarias gariepinus]|uniref:dipeptidyl peptidase 2 n=1 Tax=Clarias gariepinus TaxID=13013 RepID=UPI00234C598A|nr:dipeptidyl peptidase 2 [Clarias gariepinus]XP_053337603.1 dipeptidyl peptidase 2 [Clarias gariepinus]XP_053337604.1 dipeptidyl peptidase 2 [Clarias gariepinus]